MAPVDTKFTRELLNGETILWSGQPGPGLFAPGDILIVPLSLFIGVFTVFWEVTALGLGFGSGRSGGPLPVIMPVLGAFFVAFGLYGMVGRFFYKGWRKKRTFYAVTNQRVLVLSEAFRRKVQAASIRTLPSIDKRMRRDGSGTLRFGSYTGYGLSGTMYENTGLDFFGFFLGGPPPTFYDVRDAEKVYQLVAEQQRAG